MLQCCFRRSVESESPFEKSPRSVLWTGNFKTKNYRNKWSWTVFQIQKSLLYPLVCLLPTEIPLLKAADCVDRFEVKYTKAIFILFFYLRTSLSKFQQVTRKNGEWFEFIKGVYCIWTKESRNSRWCSTKNKRPEYSQKCSPSVMLFSVHLKFWLPWQIKKYNKN